MRITARPTAPKMAQVRTVMMFDGYIVCKKQVRQEKEDQLEYRVDYEC